MIIRNLDISNANVLTKCVNLLPGSFMHLLCSNVCVVYFRRFFVCFCSQQSIKENYEILHFEFIQEYTLSTC